MVHYYLIHRSHKSDIFLANNHQIKQSHNWRWEWNMAKTHPRRQSQGLNLHLICFLHQPNLSSLRLSSLLLVFSSASLFKSMTTSVWVAVEKKAVRGGLYCPLRVVVFGSLVSICTLIFHSAKSVKKESLSKWKKLQEKLKGKYNVMSLYLCSILNYGVYLS